VTRLTYTADKLSVQLYAAYQGEHKHEDMAEEEKGKDEICAADADGNTYVAGWYTLNFNAMYRLTDHLSISAGIENLTDQRYRHTVQAYPVRVEILFSRFGRISNSKMFPIILNVFAVS
jgi:outer membrane receptor for ferrienterochelin and colicin